MENRVFWIMALALIFSAGCNGSPVQQASAQTDQPGAGDTLVVQDAKGISTIPVQVSAIPEYLQITGRVVPDPTRVVHVFPAAGGRLLEMTIRPAGITCSRDRHLRCSKAAMSPAPWLIMKRPASMRR